MKFGLHRYRLQFSAEAEYEPVTLPAYAFYSQRRGSWVAVINVPVGWPTFRKDGYRTLTELERALMHPQHWGHTWPTGLELVEA